MIQKNTGTFQPEEQKRTDTDFKSLNLSEPILRAVTTEGYTTPTPIQAQSIPDVLQGRDLMGCAQTGTGKTAAFALPILDSLSRRPVRGPRRIRALVLSPTRELAIQIFDAFRAYGRNTNLRTAAIFGGVSQAGQTRSLRQGVDIVVATPGRLLDLKNQGFVDLAAVELFVLDEADRMLDMGFIHDVRKIVSMVPQKRQTLMFSATIPEEIKRLAAAILTDPVTVNVSPVSARAEQIEQSVIFVDKASKPDLLCRILDEAEYTRALVFTRTKHGADKLVRHLSRTGVAAESIHGNKTQGARQKALENFRTRRTPVLVATDVAARGLDIDEVSHVFNFDLPNEPETYVHRIGRTARAGASGVALSFCDFDERVQLFAIERLMRERIPVMKDGVREAVDPAAYSPVRPNMPLAYRTPKARRGFRRSR